MKIKTCGIYGIENVKTSEVYVGHSKDIAKRWSTHGTNLKNGCHDYKELQYGYDENPSNIKYFIFTTCNKNELKQEEDYYIKYVMKVDGWKLINKQKHGGASKTVKDTTNMKAAQTGENNGHNTKLSKKDVFEILDMLKDGVNTHIIEEKFDMCKGYTYRIGHDRWLKAYNEWKNIQHQANI